MDIEKILGTIQQNLPYNMDIEKILHNLYKFTYAIK